MPELTNLETALVLTDEGCVGLVSNSQKDTGEAKGGRRTDEQRGGMSDDLKLTYWGLQFGLLQSFWTQNRTPE